MGISSNQARFLALTSRQVDLEHRIQQICQRRLRLSSELENTATSYNNKISDRQLYAMNTASSGIKTLSIAGINATKDPNGNNYLLVYDTTPTAAIPLKTYDAVTSLSTNASGILSINGTATTVNLGINSSTDQAVIMDAALRAGVITLGSEKDEYTQQAYTVSGKSYAINDWRTIPSLADELYKGNDVDAENKYDKTIAEINAQDKKLQLEQTSIEVEYKAITSEKESVKKVLDTNAQTSFKYFS